MTDLTRLRRLAALGDTAAAAEVIRWRERHNEAWCVPPVPVDAHVPASPAQDLVARLAAALCISPSDVEVERGPSPHGLLAVVTALTDHERQDYAFGLAWLDPCGAYCWRVGSDDASCTSNACAPHLWFNDLWPRAIVGSDPDDGLPF